MPRAKPGFIIGHMWAIDRAAKRGAKFLDKREPGWELSVVPGRLHMEDGEMCVLGQVAGTYFRGRDRYRINDRIVRGLPAEEWYGFTLPKSLLLHDKPTVAARRKVYGWYDHLDWLKMFWQRLDEAWKAEIKSRLAKEA